jgi:3-oxoacyl-[acyl-carrier protein] reductase
MEKKLLLVGASSQIAQCVATKNTGHTIGISRQSLLEFPYQQTFQVNDYTTASLPDIDSPIEGLVYFPGTINLKPFHRLTSVEMEQDFQINVMGAIAVLQKYLPNLKQSNHSSVVLVSTVAVQKGFPFHASISLSKGAIEGLVKALSAEWAPTIRVNAVAPSLTNTPMAAKLLNSTEKIDANAKKHPLKRIGEPNDIANAIAFLLKDDSSWITGQTLSVDGGLSKIIV